MSQKNQLLNFTENYKNKLNAVTNASINFSVKPSRATALTLTRAKIELEKVEYNSLKFTPEFLAAKKKQTISDITMCMKNIIAN
tara:strand:+ start:1499 stop:1750 length:252 start_codon:yes stop_codon:yes gene_type:complete